MASASSRGPWILSEDAPITPCWYPRLARYEIYATSPGRRGRRSTKSHHSDPQNHKKLARLKKQIVFFTINIGAWDFQYLPGY